MTTPVRPKVSVIIPTYNRAAMLPRAVNSVLSQTFTDFELLIVDDGSADETPEVVAGFEDSRIRSFRHSRNRGMSAARNTGIANAQGEYVAFLDDDDEFLPTKNEKQVKSLDEASDSVGMVYVWNSVIGVDEEVLAEYRLTAEGYIFQDVLALTLPFYIGSSAMFRSEVFREIGDFDETLRTSEDLDVLCRVTQKYEVKVVSELLLRVHWGHHYWVNTPELARGGVWRADIRKHKARWRTEIRKHKWVQYNLWRVDMFLDLKEGNYLAAVYPFLRAALIRPVMVYKGAKWLAKQIVGAIWRGK